MRGYLAGFYPQLAAEGEVLQPQYRLMLSSDLTVYGANQTDGDQAHQELDLNAALGQGCTLRWCSQMACIACAEPLQRRYGGGYCYDCFKLLARCDLCVMSPERCHFDLGTCREPQWGERFCMQPHVVYLANTSGPKIGITRADRCQRRWLDQGATEAVVVAEVPTRRAAGCIEAFFARSLNDRTDWRKLVSGRSQSVDLLGLAAQLRQQMPDLSDLVLHSGHGEPQAAEDHLARMSRVLPAQERKLMQWVKNPNLQRIEFPVRQYSPAVRLTLSAQQSEVTDNLQGVLGQYLLFSQGVVNLADYRGVALEFELGDAFADSQLNTSDQLSLFEN